MTATITDFRNQFPELGSTADDVVERNLATAAQIHDANVLAQVYLTAHLITVPTTGDTPGEVTSESIGPKSADYMAQAESGDESFFTRTEYGRRYLVIAKRATTGLFKVKVL